MSFFSENKKITKNRDTNKLVGTNGTADLSVDCCLGKQFYGSSPLI